MTSASSALAVTILSGVLGAASVPARLVANTAAEPAQSVSGEPSTCPVTQPNEIEIEGRANWRNHGNDALLTILWPDSTIVFSPGGPGFVLEDGALSMKFPWWRLRNGPLTIEGRRLDGEAPPLRAHVPCCYGATGFQVSALIFPTPGCWEVTGRVAEGSLTFVTRVEKIGDGPVRRTSTPRE